MRCSTLLCGAPAEYTHRVTKEKKCARCRNQRGDGWSLAWEKIAEEEEKETFTPYIAEKQYKIFEVEGGKYIVSDKEEEHNIFASSESEAMLMASALNNAYKLGAASVLHSLCGFSVDQRRKLGIVWDGGNRENN
jgi:hypothetical protein